MHINTAVMIEPRLHKHLELVINNMLFNLSTDTSIHIFHGIKNKSFLCSRYKNEIDNNRIKLTDMNIDNLTVRQYSNILTSLKFWNAIEGDNILIFQTDSCLCMPVSEFDLSSYENYGYVGAPCKPLPSTWQNGGFSLRKRQLMIAAIKDKKINESTWPEDRFFSLVKRHITRPAPYNLALNFSVEQYYSPQPLGIHKAWLYLTPNKWKQLKKDFSAVNQVFNIL